MQQPVALRATGWATDLVLSGLAIEATGSGAGDSAAIEIEDVPSVTMEHVSALAPPNGATALGDSSYGVRITNADSADISNCLFASGAGVDGRDGVTGAPGGDGADGGDGAGHHGGGGGTGQTAGGDGGAGGGVRTGSCANGMHGKAGTGFPLIGVGGGVRGDRGESILINLLCIPTDAPTGGGHGDDGVRGAHGRGGYASTQFDTDGAYVPWPGLSGTNGTGGAGGGGGGGGATAMSVVGGPGGGGGEGGAGGNAGITGSGGGGSFAMVLANVDSATVRDTELITDHSGHGGVGGAGGNGGDGGVGGSGAAASISDPNAQILAGADGGDGGRGGDGGHGGGGSGGANAGVVLLNGTTAQLVDVVVETGDSGDGGGSLGQGGKQGQGGWNYGVYIDPDSLLVPSSTVFAALGEAGDNSPVPAKTTN